MGSTYLSRGLMRRGRDDFMFVVGVFGNLGLGRTVFELTFCVSERLLCCLTSWALASAIASLDAAFFTSATAALRALFTDVSLEVA